MMKILVFREQLRKIYSTHSAYITPALKFVLVLVAMLVINGNIGFFKALSNPAVAVFVAAVTSFLPAGIIVLLLSAVILIQLYGLAMEIAAVTLVIMLIMFILYYRFTPSDSYVLILTPILFFLNLHYLIPLLVGLVLTPVSVVSVAFGTILYYIMKYSKENAAVIANSSTESELNKIKNLIEHLLKNKELLMMLVVFVLVIVIVYVIRRMSIDHSRMIAIVVGGITQLVIMICATFILDIRGNSIWLIVVFSLLCTALVYLLNIFILSVDYSRTEYAQFEDDEYYYYVKAVPKIKVTASEVKVKHINVQKVKQK